MRITDIATRQGGKRAGRRKGRRGGREEEGVASEGDEERGYKPGNKHPRSRTDTMTMHARESK